VKRKVKSQKAGLFSDTLFGNNFLKILLNCWIHLLRLVEFIFGLVAPLLR